MIVYCESNFVLELAYEQSEATYCQQLLAAAKEGRINLAIPAYSLTEPYETLVRRSKQRTLLHTSLRDELRQLSRSSSYEAKQESFREVTGVLIDSIEEQRQALDRVVTEILEIARILPVTADVVSKALELKETLKLSPQDAFVYSSVLSDAETKPTDPKCFITLNSNDFNDDEISNDLESHQCALFFKFKDGVSHSLSAKE